MYLCNFLLLLWLVSFSFSYSGFNYYRFVLYFKSLPKGQYCCIYPPNCQLPICGKNVRSFFFRCKAVPCVADVDIYVLCIYRMIIRKGYYLSAFVNFYIISLPAEACQPKKTKTVNIGAYQDHARLWKFHQDYSVFFCLQ